MSGIQWITVGVIVLIVTAGAFVIGRIFLWREKRRIEEMWRSKGKEERVNEDL